MRSGRSHVSLCIAPVRTGSAGIAEGGEAGTEVRGRGQVLGLGHRSVVVEEEVSASCEPTAETGSRRVLRAGPHRGRSPGGSLGQTFVGDVWGEAQEESADTTGTVAPRLQPGVAAAQGTRPLPPPVGTGDGVGEEQVGDIERHGAAGSSITSLRQLPERDTDARRAMGEPE